MIMSVGSLIGVVLLLLNGAMVVLLMMLVGFQLWRLSRNFKSGVFGSRRAPYWTTREARASTGPSCTPEGAHPHLAI